MLYKFIRARPGPDPRLTIVTLAYTHTIVAELAHHVLLLVLANIDHIVARIDTISVVVEGHLTRLARNIPTLKILKESLACRRAQMINS